MKRLTVTIGIPAFNEEKSIEALLTSIVNQQQQTYVLEKIIIISDGSTDKTYSAVASFSDRRILLVKGIKNMGRVYRRNQIMSLAQSDVLVFLDGDCVLENDDSLSHLIRPFVKKSRVALVGGNPTSVTQNRNAFLSKSFLIPQRIYTRARYQIQSGNNVFGCMCGMLALRRDLYKHIKIPAAIHADDSYIYFKNLEMGNLFVNARKAKILHKFPVNIKSHVKRNKRHNKSTDELKNYFLNGLVEKEFTIPKLIFLKSSLREFINYPIHTAFIFGVNLYAKTLSKYEK